MTATTADGASVPATADAACAAIVADDMTGAGDAAIAFAEAGWPAALLLARPRPSERAAAGVLSVSTDARAAEPGKAAALTRAAVADAMRSGAQRVYLKVDSTGRGSVAGQIAGALAAWGSQGRAASAVLCPAYPELGRTVVGGLVFDRGVPAAEGASGRDPVTPLSTSDLTALVPGARRIGIADVVSLAPGEIGIVDARSRHDLEVLATAIAPAGPRVLPVGSGGLAGALARAWLGGMDRAVPRPVAIALPEIVLVTSLNPVSRAQVAHAVAAGAADLHELEEDGDAHVRGIVRAAGEAAGGRPQIIATSAARRARGRGGAAHRLAAVVGAEVAGALALRGLRSLGLIGGDGAQAVLDRLGASRAHVVGTAAAGIPLLRLDDGRMPGLIVWTKAGGFGDPGLLTDLLTHPS